MRSGAAGQGEAYPLKLSGVRQIQRKLCRKRRVRAGQVLAARGLYNRRLRLRWLELNTCGSVKSQVRAGFGVASAAWRGAVRQTVA